MIRLPAAVGFLFALMNFAAGVGTPAASREAREPSSMNTPGAGTTGAGSAR